MCATGNSVENRPDVDPHQLDMPATTPLTDYELNPCRSTLAQNGNRPSGCRLPRFPPICGFEDTRESAKVDPSPPVQLSNHSCMLPEDFNAILLADGRPAQHVARKHWRQRSLLSEVSSCEQTGYPGNTSRRRFHTIHQSTRWQVNLEMILRFKQHLLDA